MRFLDDLLYVGNSDVVPQKLVRRFSEHLIIFASENDRTRKYDIRRRNINNSDQLPVGAGCSRL